jgi:hypothetical protein
MTISSKSQYAHLRKNAATQKQATVDRLSQAITLLEAEGRPVSTFTIKEASGLDYMAYYRNREAFQLFQEHSTHLRREREKELAKRQAASRGSKGKRGKRQEPSQAIKVAPRDPLLDYQRPRLVELLREACAERDEAKRQAKEERTEAERRTQVEQAELKQRYHKLLQDHMQCGVKIARLEAELEKFRTFMEGYRTSLEREEQGS